MGWWNAVKNTVKKTWDAVKSKEGQQLWNDIKGVARRFSETDLFKQIEEEFDKIPGSGLLKFGAGVLVDVIESAVNAPENQELDDFIAEQVANRVGISKADALAGIRKVFGSVDNLLNKLS